MLQKSNKMPSKPRFLSLFLYTFNKFNKTWALFFHHIKTVYYPTHYIQSNWVIKHFWLFNTFSLRASLIRIKLTVSLKNIFNCFPSHVKGLTYTVSHFSCAPLIKCKITQKRNMIFLFWDYQSKAHLYLHYPLQFHCDQIRNEWENGSWRALPSKHHFTLHYFEWNSVHIPLFSGSDFCYARDRSLFILGNI